MAVLTIDRAKEPQNVQGTPYTTGGSIADGTYYYVVAARNGVGTNVPGPESSGITISGGGGNGRIQLNWDEVPGASSYVIYRTTTQGQYSDPCYIAEDTSPPYTDTAASPSAGAPNALESDRVRAPQMEEASLIADITVPGRDGSITQFLGRRSHGLRLEGILATSSAKGDLDKLRTYRSHGLPVRVKLQAHGQTWIDDYFTVEKLEWAPRTGRPSASGGEQVDWTTQLKQYVA